MTPRNRLVLFVISAIVLGCGTVGLWSALRVASLLPEPGFPVHFVDVTEPAGIRFRHFNGMSGKKLLPETMGSGVAVIDFDRDGRPDLFFVNSRGWPGRPVPPDNKPTQALYRNRGDGTFEDVTAALGLEIELFGMGVAAADFDNDGWPDIFVSAVGGNKLFRNLGGKRFVDATATAGVAGNATWPAAVGDAFFKVSEPLAFPSSAAWLDYDGDGRLDLLVCNYLTWSPAADIGVEAVLPNGVRAYVPPTQFRGANITLYRNIDGRRFEDVTLGAGMSVVENGSAVGKPLGVCVCDPDRDGWPDVAIACDTTRNFFFHNVASPNGFRRFEEIGLLANVAYADGRPRGGMGIDSAEILPSTFAIAIANFSNEPDTLLQRRDAKPLGFIDAAASTGLAGPSRVPMKFGALFFDADLDGRPDFLTVNGHLEPDISAAQAGQTYSQEAQLYWNTGDTRQLWEPATARQIGEDLFHPMVGRGCAVLDFDGDGDLDLVVTTNGGPARLFRNENATGHNWVAFSLVGNGVNTNRDAIGAEITIVANGRTQRHYLTTARGYLSRSDITTTFGLDDATTLDSVTVHWPNRSGQIQTWHNLSTGKRHVLSQASIATP